MLDAGVAVEDLRLVHVEQRAAFRHDHHLELPPGLDDHLPHVPALLVVALDGERADGFLPPQVRDRVFVALDGRLDRQLGAVEHGAGREEPRPELGAAANHLRVGEDGLAVVRRIVRRGHAEREIGRQRPARLREQPARLAGDVPVHVDDPRHDGLAADVDPADVRRHRNRRRRPDRGDAIVLDQNRRVLDDAGRALDRARLQARHGDDAGADQRHRARRLVAVVENPMGMPFASGSLLRALAAAAAG